jgi:hypothetical protein
MNFIKLIIIYLFISIAFTNLIDAQTTSASNRLVAQPIPDRSISFSVTDEGVSKPITWGLDLAWINETNLRRGIAFMGADRVDIVRASFQPTLPLVDGDLQTQQINDLNTRLNLIDLTGAKTKVVLNCDHPSVNTWYIGNAVNWAQLIDATTKRVQARGRTVVSVSPFNEPDYGWGQFSGQNGQSDFFNICSELRKNSRFDSIRISGGNTLNCDQALPWYNYLKSKLEEGNTHQLAGSFDNFANFLTTVRANGDVATGDELHNVMEPMVGAEYGMQTGIWWGTAELARGEFVKASDGKRLGYAEHRPNWTAASVYRNTEGKVQAFGGTSERQAVTTSYRFVSKDKDVFYDGYGPQREYTMVLPGGTGYQNGQTGAERVVNISWGDDIQPVINGKYILVNRLSGKVMEVSLGNTSNGGVICQRTYSGATHQQWNVTPVDSRIGGDFSYFTLKVEHTGKVPDVLNFSLDNAASIIQYDDNKNSNQQWYLEYAGDGWFYIRNRHSAKCMKVAAPYVSNGAAIQQWEKDGSVTEQWRFLPVDAPVEFVSPAAPANLTAIPNSVSVKLEWSASADADVAGYTIFRADSSGGPYNTIARDVKTTSFIDNTTTSSGQYFYTVKAVDKSLNRSGYSNEAAVTVSEYNDLITRLQFDGNTMDSSIHLNHSATYGGATFVDGKTGPKAIFLNGTDAFVQLPAHVANHREITIAAWIYFRGLTAWQRIFDFGNDQAENMYLTPKNNSGKMRFAIKKGGAEQALETTSPTLLKWAHVAVTLSKTGARMYVNGLQVAESGAITISPIDFKPVLNYIGRSQYPDPLLNGYIDDFRIYNYALSANDIAQVAGIISSSISPDENNNDLSIRPLPAKNIIYLKFPAINPNEKSSITIFSSEGSLVLSKEIQNINETELNISDLTDGVYMVRLSGNGQTYTKKLIIKH